MISRGLMRHWFSHRVMYNSIVWRGVLRPRRIEFSLGYMGRLRYVGGAILDSCRQLPHFRHCCKGAPRMYGSLTSRSNGCLLYRRVLCTKGDILSTVFLAIIGSRCIVSRIFMTANPGCTYFAMLLFCRSPRRVHSTAGIAYFIGWRAGDAHLREGTCCHKVFFFCAGEGYHCRLCRVVCLWTR